MLGIVPVIASAHYRPLFLWGRERNDDEHRQAQQAEHGAQRSFKELTSGNRHPIRRAKEETMHPREGVLAFAAAGEVATGVTLFFVPSLVGQWLLGTEMTGIAVTSRAWLASL